VPSRPARSIVALLLLALALPAVAVADPGTASVLSPDGHVVSTAPAQAGWAYPDDGSIVQVADAIDGGGRLELFGVSLLGGRLVLGHASVGASTRIDDVTLDGRAIRVGANTVVAIPGAGWAVLDQQAVVPLSAGGTRRTTVALRLHLSVGLAGAPSGTEVIVGYGATAPGARLVGSAREIPTELVPIYRAAARRYGVPWSVLAAINRVETSFGRNLSTSSAGAIGWMQFMPATWSAYGVDASGDGRADPYDPTDAIFSAAALLAANGAARDLHGAIWLYNHSEAYVSTVLSLASGYANGEALAPAVAGAGPLDDNGALFSPITLW
jgi:hypothetical protein